MGGRLLIQRTRCRSVPGHSRDRCGRGAFWNSRASRREIVRRSETRSARADARGQILFSPQRVATA